MEGLGLVVCVWVQLAVRVGVQCNVRLSVWLVGDGV